jgi:hypothetical protein
LREEHTFEVTGQKENTDVIRSFTEPNFHLLPLQSRTHRRMRCGVKQIHIQFFLKKKKDNILPMDNVRREFLSSFHYIAGKS